MAGRTRNPAAQPLPVRTGGFGGVDGLTKYLRAESIHVLVDATHPYAAQMSCHAVLASEQTDTALLAIRRPPWQPGPGDQWVMVPDMAAAADAMGEAPRKVFLTVGQNELEPFKGVRRHSFVLRSIDLPPAEMTPLDATILTARGPFQLEDETSLMVNHGIEVMITKNSGGTATAAKLEAARNLDITVIMVERPQLPDLEHLDRAQVVTGADAAFDWIVKFDLTCHRTDSMS